ncbi:hypothetical protein [Arcobacter peruensis]|nr:hypothetical protein [Arcobacter peruensis]
MTTFSNSSVKRSMIDEINSIFIEFFDVSKNFLYKHHKVLGYF